MGDDAQVTGTVVQNFKVLELLVGEIDSGVDGLVIHVESHVCALRLHEHLVQATDRSLWWTESDVRLLALRREEQVVVSAPLGDPADAQRLSEVQEVIVWWDDQTLAPVSVAVGGLMREM